jgi:hypothetical protein
MGFLETQKDVGETSMIRGFRQWVRSQIQSGNERAIAYYQEQIIRDEESCEKIREYILNNPIAWEDEPLHLEKYHAQPDM